MADNSGMEGWNQILFLVQVPPRQSLKAKIRIIKTEKKNVIFGVVDSLARRHERSFYNPIYSATYSGWNATTWPDQKKEGNGFKEGDIVEVIADRQIGKVEWKDNGASQASMVSDYIKGQVGSIVPYV